ncbi:MAG: ATP-binding protein [Chloroflexi bacterium]|nr:MAG: ATP-binding protein [Chloroflexota bacterium]
MRDGSIPDYHPARFVNREPEINLVVGRAQEIGGNQVVRRRTIIFAGERGSGKTWLLRHLAEVTLLPPGLPTGKQLKRAGAHAVYFSLLDGHQIADLIRALGKQIAQWQGGAPLVPQQGNIPLDDLSRLLQQDVERLVHQTPLVLLVDHVYEADEALLTELERRLLAPLATLPRVLLVLAGRGKPYPWVAPELRLYVEERTLAPFDVETTKAQLERQAPDKADQAPQIQRRSWGYPLANYLLATKDDLAVVIEAILDHVKSEARTYLEALCLLRFFTEDQIPVMLAAYHDNDQYRRWGYKKAREVRDRLLDTALTHWDSERGGYVVDEAVRPLLGQHLRERDPRCWQRLHCAAHRLYRSWAKTYPQTGARWAAEADYHAQALRQAGYVPEGC